MHQVLYCTVLSLKQPPSCEQGMRSGKEKATHLKSLWNKWICKIKRDWESQDYNRKADEEYEMTDEGGEAVDDVSKLSMTLWIWSGQLSLFYVLLCHQMSDWLIGKMVKWNGTDMTKQLSEVVLSWQSVTLTHSQMDRLKWIWGCQPLQVCLVTLISLLLSLYMSLSFLYTHTQDISNSVYLIY